MAGKRIAVLTSGGDAPGMNAAIRAVVRMGIGNGWETFGVRNGYLGLVEGGSNISPLGPRDVGGILGLGGTFLGSARLEEFKEEGTRKKGLANLAAHDIDSLVVIGGNGSQAGALALSKMGLPVVGVASTIDNDLVGSEITIGVDTALNIALEAIDRLRVTRLGHVQRGGTPGAFDRLLATRLAVGAVEALARGEHGCLVGLQKGDVRATPLGEVVGVPKSIDLNLLHLQKVLAK